MDDKPIVFDVRPGYLGWSNVRSGTEFYRLDGKNNRWEPRQPPDGLATDGSSGLLLQDDIWREAKCGEGSVCVVITCGTRDPAIAYALAKELQDKFASAQTGGA